MISLCDRIVLEFFSADSIEWNSSIALAKVCFGLYAIRFEYPRVHRQFNYEVCLPACQQSHNELPVHVNCATNHDTINSLVCCT